MPSLRREQIWLGNSSCGHWFPPVLPLAASGARAGCPQVTSQSDVLEEQKQQWGFCVGERS